MKGSSIDKYEIYIGLKDRETMLDRYTIDDFAKILAEECADKQIGFSMTRQLGGYAHAKTYIIEPSVRITLFGISEEDVFRLGERLAEHIGKDALMITREECEYFYR